ncbi:CII family transcriptional regulator [Ectopseudomonas alcaliphila]|uniref:Bacteriophage CII protein n=1 Tax=Ectopseudomonas alcaliphila TaxID=101564 RepID=A0A1G7JE62_9GAMM|nr:CII family transcriptional regulator [Pseudomonas alcaliphila]MDX5990454.1 CII family transcriptional regulator [Pseudomonas alcaliphila]MDX5995424.1 CII family transcriptional regulator [Pseudomonas alcaliphila]MDX5995469.1 CII family transcriptional regulator [Pseudomonas alcaliphila]SDF23232.1 Bacteriophage CII protein [Pseudomonas alcaliphila]
MSTETLSQDQTVRARKNYSVLMRALASVGNAPVALAVGCDEATISRMKPEKFEQFCQILAVLDLKVVPSDMRCFNERDIETILHQAKRWMEHVQGIDQLEFD